MPLPLKIITTDDGSSSLYNDELKETYHSFHGAIQESRHVFIKNGLNYWLEQHANTSPTLLEVGFGTGLNALLTLEQLHLMGRSATYVTLEAYPLDAEIVKGLNYVQQLATALADRYFQALHTLPWGLSAQVSDLLTIEKHKVTLESFVPDRHFDVIYFDAFAPNKQPEMWTLDVLTKVTSTLTTGGVFVTYCAKGQLKRDLRALGLEVETLDGPPGKKEMVRALRP